MRRLWEMEGAVSTSFTSSQLSGAMKKAAVGLWWAGVARQPKQFAPPTGVLSLPPPLPPAALTDTHQLGAAPRRAVTGFGTLTSMLSSHVCRLATASSPRARFQVTTYRALSVKKHWLTVDMLAGPPMSHTLNDTKSFCVRRRDNSRVHLDEGAATAALGPYCRKVWEPMFYKIHRLFVGGGFLFLSFWFVLNANCAFFLICFNWTLQIVGTKTWRENSIKFNNKWVVKNWKYQLLQ